MTALQNLTKLVNTTDRYSTPIADLIPAQMEAARERLAQHSATIQFVKNRIEDTGVKDVKSPDDLVPLLFAHTAYKSYPEGWLNKGRWDMLTQWLDTVTHERVEGVDLKGVTGIDEWLVRLGAKGHHVTCSSGTTGKVSMIPSNMADRRFAQRALATGYEWGTGLKPEKTHKLYICNPGTNNNRFLDSWDELNACFGQDNDVYRLPGEPITIGRIREMVALRKAINEGTARPADIAAFEKMGAEREKMMDDAVEGLVEAILADRGRKIMFSGMFVFMYKVAAAVRAKGYGKKDFNPDNYMMVSGGLKGADLPSDYREQIMETFNVPLRHAFAMYGMQELNSLSALCTADRYHVPPWLILLVLDQSGEKLIDNRFKGEVEGRAGFFDLSHEGRWGGLISGDKIHVNFGKCACGHEGPSIGMNIQRYSDLPGGDKISCSGTIDAYVRGAA